MIELTTLGAVDLHDTDGVDLRAVLVQPKRTALLVYLAVAQPRGFHRRDALLALFWPEQDAAHARTALRQALHGLRVALGVDTLIARGDEELALHAGRCACDVRAFEQALDARDSDRAVDLYRGPFLDGFFLSGAPAFERWVESERDRLSRRYASGLEHLAQEAERRSDLPAAVSWWSRLATHSPHPSRIAVRLMRALDAAGDRAGAIRHADQHAARLRADLDAAPDPEVEALAVQLRSRSSRREGPPVVGTRPESVPLRRVASARTRRHRLARKLLAPIAGVLLLGFAGWEVLRRGAVDIATSDIRPVTSEPGVEFQPALSPDGREVAFIAGPPEKRRLIVRSTVNVTGAGESRLADTVSGSPWLPRWSPDGEFVRFLLCPGGSSWWSDACDWKEIGRRGGLVRSIAVPRHAWTAAWSPDDSRIAFSSHDSVFSAPAAGGPAVLLAVHSDRPTGLHSLAWSPDGRRVAYVHGNVQWLGTGNILGSSIWVVDVAGGGSTRITGEESLNQSPTWLDDRHLLFVSSRDGPRGIYVVEVGPEGPRGEPRSVPGASDVHAISYATAGRRLAYAKLSLRQNVWSYPLGGAKPTPVGAGRPVTDGNQVVEEHDLSPDGRWLVYDSNLGGDANIYKISLGGGGSAQLTSQPGDDLGPRWSPDGTEIVFYGAHREIFVVSAEGGAPVRLTAGEGSGVNPRWSPNGLEIAFSPGGLGPRELRFLARDRVGGPWRRPARLTDIKCQPQAWAPDGRAVLCIDDRGALMIVSPNGRVLWRRDLRATYRLRLRSSYSAYSTDGSTIYVVAAHDDGRRGIWSISVHGDGPAQLVVSDDASAPHVLGALTAGPSTLYVTVPQYESDVWTMTLRR